MPTNDDTDPLEAEQRQRELMREHAAKLKARWDSEPLDTYRYEFIEKLAAQLYIHNEKPPDVCFDLAQDFYDEREKRRGDFMANIPPPDPMSLEGHRFMPAQGDPAFCLECGKRRELHPQ